MKEREDKIAGCLLGTAVGDALGLPCEGMRAIVVARRFPALDRYRLLGRTGFVSDDTEQSALIGQSLIAARGDSDLAAGATRRFRRAMLGWFFRLPFGIGLGTVRSCFRMALRFRVTGVDSAGNGAAMRAGIVGAALPHDAERRRALGRVLAEVTHRHPRAVEGALFVAEVAAAGARGETERAAMAEAALEVVQEPVLRPALVQALALAGQGASLEDAAGSLGNSGYVVHSVALAAFCFVRFGGLEAVRAAIRAGGDTDTNAAIVGSWVGAQLGARGLPSDLVEHLQSGPFGRAHLEALASALADDDVTRAPGYAWPLALVRNLAMYPVVLAHGFRRAIPF